MRRCAVAESAAILWATGVTRDSSWQRQGYHVKASRSCGACPRGPMRAYCAAAHAVAWAGDGLRPACL